MSHLSCSPRAIGELALALALPFLAGHAVAEEHGLPFFSNQLTPNERIFTRPHGTGIQGSGHDLGIDRQLPDGS